MKTRIFHTKFWTDPYILRLDTKARCLFNFYLSNDRIGILGVYEIPMMLVQMSTGLSIEEIEQYNKKFMEDGKIIFYEEWVCVVNAVKYQAYTGSLNEKARDKEIDLLPLEVKGFFSKYTLQGVLETSNSLRKRNNKSENENEREYSVGGKKVEIKGNTAYLEDKN